MVQNPSIFLYSWKNKHVESQILTAKHDHTYKKSLLQSACESPPHILYFSLLLKVKSEVEYNTSIRYKRYNEVRVYQNKFPSPQHFVLDVIYCNCKLTITGCIKTMFKAPFVLLTM